MCPVFVYIFTDTLIDSSALTLSITLLISGIYILLWMFKNILTRKQVYVMSTHQWQRCSLFTLNVTP